MDVFLETTSSIRTATGTLTDIPWQQVIVWIHEHRPTAAKIELNVLASGSLRGRPSIMTDTAGLNLLFADLPGSIFFRESQERDDISGNLYLIDIARIDPQSLASKHWHAHKAGSPTDSCEAVCHSGGIVPRWWW